MLITSVASDLLCRCLARARPTSTLPTTGRPTPSLRTRYAMRKVGEVVALKGVGLAYIIANRAITEYLLSFDLVAPS